MQWSHLLSDIFAQLAADWLSCNFLPLYKNVFEIHSFLAMLGSVFSLFLLIRVRLCVLLELGSALNVTVHYGIIHIAFSINLC